MLLNRDDLVPGVVNKIKDPSEYNNFVNWSLDYFGLDWKIQAFKQGHTKLKFAKRLRKILSVNPA